MALNLEELDTELSRMRRMVQEWAETRIRLAADRRDQHAAVMQDQTEKLTQMEERKQQLHVTAEKTNRRLLSEQQELQSLTEQRERAEADASTAKQRRDAVEVQLQQEHNQRLARLAELEAAAKKKQRKLNSYIHLLTMFRDRLCMDVRPLPGGGVNIVMTHVDEKDHSKEFVITVRMDDMRYSAIQCNPPVPGVEELLAEVNSTNNLGKAIKEIRSRFVQIARQSQGQ